MNKRAWIATACVLVFTGCAHHSGSPRAAPRPDAPKVFVTLDKHIVVDQEPLVFARDQRDVKIVWEIAPPNSPWRFGHHNSARPGIVIQRPDDEIVGCHQEADGRRFACVNRHRKPGQYKYTINLTGPSNLSLDPIIVND